jgi:hypothetical protein
MKAYYGPMKVLYEKPGFDPDRLVAMFSFLTSNFVFYWNPTPQKVDDQTIRNPSQQDLDQVLADLMRNAKPKKDETPPKHNP